jgi:hypothetical protein
MAKNLSLRLVLFLVVFFLVFGALAIRFSFRPFLDISSKDSGVSSSEENTKYSDAFIDPKKVLSDEEIYEGVVMSVEPENGSVNKYQFKLIDEGKNTVAYLLSKGELLKFVEGHGIIKLVGKLQTKTQDGVDVIYVKSVSLK